MSSHDQFELWILNRIEAKKYFPFKGKYGQQSIEIKILEQVYNKYRDIKFGHYPSQPESKDEGSEQK